MVAHGWLRTMARNDRALEGNCAPEELEAARNDREADQQNRGQPLVTVQEAMEIVHDLGVLVDAEALQFFIIMLRPQRIGIWRMVSGKYFFLVRPG